MDDYISVSEFNSKLKSVIKDNFREKINIIGEIYNYKKSNSNIYASLRDEYGSINIIQWRTSNNFKNGDTVIITGTIDYYTKSSNVNIIANKIELTGEGKIYKILEDRKIEFESKGYFDETNKKALPEINSIGIVTAMNGAALQDMLYVFKYNKFKPKIFIKNASVQGTECPSTIKSGIEYFNEILNVHVIIIARGGGSIEDLMGFSDPIILEAIHKSQICVISAIGHEIDFMLSDYVADIRAPTPSIAAEIICKTQINISSEIDSYNKKLKTYQMFINDHIKTLIRTFLKIKTAYITSNTAYITIKINLIDNKIKSIITNKIADFKKLYEILKIKMEDYDKTKYNSIILFDNKIINSIDMIKDGKYKIMINDKEINVKLKIIP